MPWVLKERLTSECGEFEAVHEGPGCTDYLMGRVGGPSLERPVAYGNYGTGSRVRFKLTTPDGKSAFFSYPDHPPGFRRRWVSVFDIELEALRDLVVEAGGRVVIAGKPSFCAWWHVGFFASVKVRQAVDAALRSRKIKFLNRGGRGGFDFGCPPEDDPRFIEVEEKSTG